MKQLSLHITDLCNEKCGFCVVGSPLAKSDSVVYADLVRFLVDNVDEGFESVNLHGGEPTIHPRLFELLNLIKMLEYPQTHIQTNARRLKNAEFTEKLAAHGVTLCIVSMHGATASIQDCLTQTPGGFKETVEGIRNARKAGIAVSTNTVLTRMNMGQLENLCRLCLDLGVERINISNLHPVGSGYFALDMQAPTVAETKQYLLPVLDLATKYPVKMTLEGFPLCLVHPYERLAIEDGTRFIRMIYRGGVSDNYDDYMAEVHREYGPPCEGCALRTDCTGVYHEYAERRGWDGFGLTAAQPAAMVR